MKLQHFEIDLQIQQYNNKDGTENWNILKFLFNQDLAGKGGPIGA